MNQASAGPASDTPVLATGLTGDVREETPSTFVKCYHDGLAELLRDREFHFARLAHASGVPTPEPLARIELDGAPAIRFERSSGERLDRWARFRPLRWRPFAARLAALHAQLHVVHAEPDFDIDRPRQAQLYRYLIEAASPLTDEQRTICLEALEHPSRRERLCHGNLSPGNVLVDGRDLSVTDWSLASAGDPVLDVATTWVGVHAFSARVDLPPGLAQLLRSAGNAYLDTYLKVAERPPSRAELESLLPVAAAARLGVLQLADGSSAERDSLRLLFQTWLHRAAPSPLPSAERHAAG